MFLYDDFLEVGFWGKFIYLTIGAILILFILEGIEYCFYMQEYYRSTPLEIHAALISNDFEPSTLQHHMDPVFYSSSKGGIKMAMVSRTTGHSERYTTIWQTKEYGRLMSDNKKVWQYAQPESTLLIKMWLGEPYIDDIKTN